MNNENARLSQLNSGLRVVTRYAERAISTDIHIKTLAGARDEVDGDYPRGTAHANEHAMCYGSENYSTPTRELIEGTEGFDDEKGHHFTPATMFSYTHFGASVPATSTHESLDVLVDVVSRPNFPEPHVEQELEPIGTEWLECGFDFGTAETCMTPHVGHGKHPRLFPVIGDEESIRTISAEHMRTFHAENFRAGRTVIAVEGDVDHDDIVAAVEKRFCLSPGIRPLTEVPIYTGGDQRHALPLRGTRVVLAFKGPTDSEFEACATFQVLTSLLCQNKGKHSIFQAMRGERRAIYKVGVTRLQALDAGLLNIAFVAFPDKVRTCLDAIHIVLSDLTTRVDDEVFARIKRIEERRYKAQQNLFKVGVANLADDIFQHGRLMPPEYECGLKLQVTENDIRNCAREMLLYPPTFVAAGKLEGLPSADEVRDLFYCERSQEQRANSVTSVKSNAAIQVWGRPAFI